MTSILRWVRALTRRARAPLAPLQFPTSGFDTIPQHIIAEEEQFAEFKAGLYYPVNIGEVYASKYQILGELGFGTTSTVWLARNLLDRQHVALKVYTREQGHGDEFQNYQRVSTGNSRHPGYRYVRRALDQLLLPRPGGDHHCLVLKPCSDSWRDLLRYNPFHRFSEDLLKAGIQMVLFALDYLHTECKLVHTDIKADNIMTELVDDQVLRAFTRAELDTPTPRKSVEGKPLYLSRWFKRPREWGVSVLSDFGSVVRGDLKRNHDAQPDVCRSPEVMLKVEWSYQVDIWNVGCMIWDLFEGKHLFYGQDPSGKGYMTRAHLAELVGMLGPPPVDLLRRGVRSSEFFADDGKPRLVFHQVLATLSANGIMSGRWIAEVEIPKDNSLEASEERLEGEYKAKFFEFMRGMLQWRPEDRKTAKQLLEAPWLNSPGP